MNCAYVYIYLGSIIVLQAIVFFLLNIIRHTNIFHVCIV